MQAIALGIAASLAIAVLEPQKPEHDRGLSFAFTAIVGCLVALAVWLH